MTKQEIIALANANPVMQLATVDEEGNPRTRAIFMYAADEDGIVFHVGSFKPVSREIAHHPKVEVSFYNPAVGTQIRVSGETVEIKDQSFKEKIVATPGREFLKPIVEKSGYDVFRVFRITHCRAAVWTMSTNTVYPKEEILFG